MRKQTEPPSSLRSFGMGVAVGFGAGIAVKILWPGATALAEAVLSKLGFEMGDFFLTIWNPEERSRRKIRPRAQTMAPPKKKPRKPRAKAPARPRTTTVGRVKKSANPRAVKPVAKLSKRAGGRPRLVAPLGVGSN